MNDPSALIDRIVSDLLALKAAIAGDCSEAPEDDLIDTASAADRFDLPLDTIRWLCREKGMGQKRSGRWLISQSALETYKREKRE